jgi:hypothetical protein
MESITAVFSALDNVSPLALAALLGYVIYLLVRQRQQVSTLKDNHLSELPEMLALLTALEKGQGEIRECGQRIEAAVHSLAGYLHGRANGTRS